MSSASAALVAEIRQMVAAIRPWDELEAAHLEDAYSWLGSTNDVFRRSTSPTRPLKHLLSYFLLIDSASGRMLLGEHRRARLWLPSGGHVEPGEHPVITVKRECLEELRIPAKFDPHCGEHPIFLTVTPTSGTVEPHTDVSLWFVLRTSRPQEVRADTREYLSVRWWRTDEVRRGDPGLFDPHMIRMVDKLQSVVNSNDDEASSQQTGKDAQGYDSDKSPRLARSIRGRRRAANS